MAGLNIKDIVNQSKKPAVVKDMHPMVSFQEAQKIIFKNLVSASESFISIGYYLKLIRDNQMYLEGGFSDIWEFASATYGIGKSATSRWMAMNDKYSVDGNSPYIQDRFKGYGKSQLQEMLYLTDEQLVQVEEGMTVKEIREVRRLEPVEEAPEPETVATSQQTTFCDGKCFNCKRESCNGKQIPREHCVLDNKYSCTSVHIFDQVKSELPEIYENCVGCCNACTQKSICGYACNRPEYIQKERQQKEMDPAEYPEMKSIDEEIHVEAMEVEVVSEELCEEAVATSQQMKEATIEYGLKAVFDCLGEARAHLNNLKNAGFENHEKPVIKQKIFVDALILLYHDMLPGGDSYE